MDEDWDAPYVPQPQAEYYSPDTSKAESRPQNTNWRNNSNSTYQKRYNRRENGSNMHDESDTSIMKVPTRFVGRIIGRGGSKIHELQSETNTKIIVTKEIDGDNTIIKIKGDQNSTKLAKDLINDLTTEKITFVENHTKEEPVRASTEKSIDWKKLFQECEAQDKQKWDQMTPIEKNFYQEHPEVSQMSMEEVEYFRKESNNIVVDRTFKNENSRPVPKPCITFEHAFHQYPEILDEIAKAGFTKPSPIQSQGWPVLLSGEDLIGIAQTGTGKTLAFLLPALIHIDGQQTPREERDGPNVLVMAPTRELALQIEKEVKKYQYKGINAVCLYGGGNRQEQIKVVTNGVNIVIATPGRLNDLIQMGHLNVKTITYVVLDEADRMLDMGFEPQIRKVMYMIRPNRQTVMTSATWPSGVRRLAQSYMVDPIQVYIGTLDLAATHTVTQIIQVLQEEEKFEVFMGFINSLAPEEKAIVFCGKKSRADNLASELSLLGIDCQTLHGDREQCDREQALVDIKDGTVQILIATDVASRGLDIEDITHVINYDFPRNIEEYVHRVGRTGRAGKTGQSISYVTRGDWGQAKELISILEEAQQYVPEEIYSMAERFEVWKEKKDKEKKFCNNRGGGGGFRNNSRW